MCAGRMKVWPVPIWAVLVAATLLIFSENLISYTGDIGELPVNLMGALLYVALGYVGAKVIADTYRQPGRAKDRLTSILFGLVLVLMCFAQIVSFVDKNINLSLEFVQSFMRILKHVSTLSVAYLFYYIVRHHFGDKVNLHSKLFNKVIYLTLAIIASYFFNIILNNSLDVRLVFVSGILIYFAEIILSRQQDAGTIDAAKDTSSPRIKA